MNTPDNRADNRPDKHFEQRARALYQEACQRIDPVTAGRLRAARRHALEVAKAPPRHTIRWLIPTGAFAVAALATLMVWQPLPRRATAPSSQAISLPDQSADADNDLPPDADKTDPNLYQNLDFYGWLAANSAQNSQPANR
jgi:hypothetical protein